MHNEDVSLKGVLLFLGILVLTLVGAFLLIGAMSRSLEKDARKSDGLAALEAPPAYAIADRPYFPAPREQPVPLEDREALRARDEAELNSYGWVDRTTGVVRIPIDRAMALLAQPEARP